MVIALRADLHVCFEVFAVNRGATFAVFTFDENTLSFNRSFGCRSDLGNLFIFPFEPGHKELLLVVLAMTAMELRIVPSGDILVKPRR